tara:strand:- start:979 stop:1791 length:813 start_codon:yes stop_codon:yes gene_type:complete
VIAPFIPGGQPLAAVSALKVRSDVQRQQKENIEIFNRNRKQAMNEFEALHGISRNNRLTTTANAGGGFGSSIGSFFTDLGRNVVNPFIDLVSPFTNKFGGSNVTQPATTTPTLGGGGQETSTSGTSEAFMGSVPSIISSGSRFLKSPGGGFLTGLFGGALPSLIDPNTGQTKRITRKMKSQARMLLNMTGGNLAATADMLNITQDELVFILLKRFRNDGPVVTKAALRKTKQTIRRLHNMQDVLKSITPTAAGRRRAPMKRATTTLISNK